MVTRVRIEAEAPSLAEVENTIHLAADTVCNGVPDATMDAMFGEPNENDVRPGLADAQAGEFVVERFAKDLDGGRNHGVVFYRGRMTLHFAPPAKKLDLRQRQSESPYAAY